MLKKRVFILQDNEGIISAISTTLNGSEFFEVVGYATDGNQGAKRITELYPDLLITELVLAGLDGLSVIEKFKQTNPDGKVLVVSAVSREEIVTKAMEKGANYYMVKPISTGVMMERAKELFEVNSKERFTVEGRKETMDEKISNIFINVGIPPHIKGYSYLREGVKIAVDNPDVINNITKKLYPMIGEKYETTASKVERAIRHAIEVAWNRGRIESINAILGVRAYVGQEKPTNGEFIALVADKMLLERA